MNLKLDMIDFDRLKYPDGNLCVKTGLVSYSIRIYC